MPDQLYPWMHLIGRILFSMMFIVMAMMHFMKTDEFVQMAESKGVPGGKATVMLSGLVILAGGLMVVTGWHRFIGAGLLAIFLVVVAFTIHAFWKETDEMARMNQMSHFMKNLVMAGGALMIAYYSATYWPMSLGG